MTRSISSLAAFPGATIDKLLNQDYSASYGFPSLPATVRFASVSLGGD
jgi:hypothetical protein